MTKIILVLLVCAMAFVVLRMALNKAGFKRTPVKNAAMTQLKKELNILLWIPPVLIGLGGIYAIGSALWRQFG